MQIWVWGLRWGRRVSISIVTSCLMMSMVRLQEPHFDGELLRYYVYFLVPRSIFSPSIPSAPATPILMGATFPELWNAGECWDLLANLCTWGREHLPGFKIGHVHSFAQNRRHSSGTEHCCCGQLRVSLIFVFIRWFAFLHLDVQRIPSLFLRLSDSPGCFLIWSCDVFWLCQVAVSAFHSGNLSAMCLGMVCALLLGSPPQSISKACDGGYAFCDKGCGLWTTKLFPCLLHMLLEVSLSQDPLSWGRWRWGREEAETDGGKNTLWATPQVPTPSPALVALLSLEGLSGCNIHF